MNRPLLTVVIPTQGRDSLPRALDSIRVQAGSELVQILVVADTHSPLLSDVRSVAQIVGARYLELDAGCHAFGYPQIQRGYEQADGQYVACIGDDDVYVAGGLSLVLDAIRSQEEPQPLVFRLRQMRHGGIVLGAELVRGSISTQNLIAPNDRAKLGFWWDDFSMIYATIHRHGGRAVWREEVILDAH